MDKMLVSCKLFVGAKTKITPLISHHVNCAVEHETRDVEINRVAIPVRVENLLSKRTLKKLESLRSHFWMKSNV